MVDIDYELEEQYLQYAMNYYKDAPMWVWSNPIVKRSVRHGRWAECGVKTGDDGLPIQGLMLWELNGYKFKYNGLPVLLGENCTIQ